MHAKSFRVPLKLLAAPPPRAHVFRGSWLRRSARVSGMCERETQGAGRVRAEEARREFEVWGVALAVGRAPRAWDSDARVRGPRPRLLPVRLGPPLPAGRARAALSGEPPGERAGDSWGKWRGRRSPRMSATYPGAAPGVAFSPIHKQLRAAG